MQAILPETVRNRNDKDRRKIMQTKRKTMIVTSAARAVRRNTEVLVPNKRPECQLLIYDEESVSWVRRCQPSARDVSFRANRENWL
jgi:hypothetical protein